MELTQVSPQLHVYYDGLCVVCSHEIEFYRKRAPEGAIRWVDIAAPDFDIIAEGLESREIHKLFHVKEANGKIIAGVEGFIKIWESIPSLHFLSTLARIPGAKAAMRLGYILFVRLRPYLPRKVAPACATGACDIPKV